MANGTGQGSVPANEPKVAQGHSTPSILSRDRVSSIKNFMGVVVRISVMIVVFLVLTYLAHLFLRRESDRSESPGVAVFNWLEQLPTEPAFHYLVAVLAGAYLGWCWYLSANLREEIRIREANEDKSSLTSRDWWVVRGLRGRALAFRTLAGVLLGSVVALLFSGIYLAMFGVPQILTRDQSLTQETLLTSVRRQFGHRLRLMGEGRYWFKAANVSRDTSTSEEGSISELLRIANTQLTDMVLPAGATLLRLPALNTHEVSKDELTIFAVDYGKALVTRDGGETWSTPKGLGLKDLAPEETEEIIAAAFDADGRFGVVGSVGGSTFVTQDGGKTWNVPKGLMLDEGEWIVAAAFGPGSRPSVVGGTKGSAFVTQDGGRIWAVPEGLMLKEDEWIVAAAFGPDGRPGVVGGDEGSVFVTQDGGETWTVPEGLMLNENEWIVAAAFGANNTYGVISNNKGSIFLTQDSGKTWIAPKDSALEETEWIITAAFDADGRSGIVVGDEGSVFLTQDGGKTWSIPENLVLKGDERMITTAFDADGRFGVVAGDKGSVFLTQDGGKTWSAPENLVLKGDEKMITTAFDADGRFGVIAGDKGSVFITQDKGKTWSDSDGLKLNEGERIVAAAFSTDGKHGVVTGDEGSVFATQSSGRSWTSTERDSQGTIFIDVVSALPGGRNFVAMDDDRGIHLLKPYPDMAEWENRSLDAIRIRIQKDEILRKSVIGRAITKLLDSVPGADVNVGDGETLKPDNDKPLFSRLFGELTGIRVVVLVVLLFLVQILVRLYQYSLRLAVFWDARADAVLLARSFAYHSAETFDDLVAALAPDAYDFKPSPKSGHEGMMNSVGQLLRRESRKS